MMQMSVSQFSKFFYMLYDLSTLPQLTGFFIALFSVCIKVPDSTTHSHADPNIIWSYAWLFHKQLLLCRMTHGSFHVQSSSQEKSCPALMESTFYSSYIHTKQLQPSTYILSCYICQQLRVFVSCLGSKAPWIRSPLPFFTSWD